MAAQPAGSRLCDWGRVLRLSLAPTAAADVLAGASLAGLTDLRAICGLVLASLAVYHGGMALNDWADRGGDALARPERPLPSGALQPAAVLAAALALFVLGLAAATWVSPRAGLWMAAVALAAIVYDLVGRGPWRGPALLAFCRAGNLATPLLAFPLAGSRPALFLAAPLAYGLFVFVVSRLGRLEDAEDDLVCDRRPRRLVATLILIFLCLPALPVPSLPLYGRLAALALALFASFGLLRARSAPGPWTLSRVRSTMGLALARLSLVTACLALLPGTRASFALAFLILLGFPLSRALRGVFPPS